MLRKCFRQKEKSLVGKGRMEKFAAAGSNFKICCRDISPHDPSRGRNDGRLLSH